MAWTLPVSDRELVNKAGRAILSDDLNAEDYENALLIVNNWRSAHNFPLNTFKISLINKATKVDHSALVAQRIKRLPSIKLKLQLIPSLKLSQVQDIGGCRAVLQNVTQVNKLVRIYQKSDLKHELLKIDDYISVPKKSGYRSIHLVYRYFSDRNTNYNGLKIEMQIRSILQHSWATAVETVGTFLRQALKSSLGDEDWKRFFALMGTAISIRERGNPVPNTPLKEGELKKEIREYDRKLKVERHLRAYHAALRVSDTPVSKESKYFLLKLDSATETVTIRRYKSQELEQASNDYLETEKSILGQDGADAVLVSVQSLESLKRAYPNYFLDTDLFIRAVKEAVS
ncbi:MAG: RelA/SpoT domain-containing protein [Chthoniobacteraceae bacterium]|jgi:ppGpp synthetase/RelA/SpoT-type nucleotidyltranferase